MYYPSSQIQTNLYSNGSLIIKSTQQTYTGFYWSTSLGKFFAGKTPDSPQSSIELINPSNIPSPRNLDFHDPSENENTVKISYSSFDVVNYLKLNPGINTDKLPQIPTYIPSSPTKENYEIGKFTRFFCKQKNTPLFIEIDQTTYTKLLENNPELDYEMFLPFKFSWVLIGEQDRVALQNKNTVDFIENQEGALGLSQYLNYNYLLHYNTTPGITKRNSKRIYADNGIEVPLNLPKNYRLIKDNKACASCVYFQRGICSKWSAPIRQNYYCNAFKSLKSLSSQEIIDTLSSTTNIYNQNNSY